MMYAASISVAIATSNQPAASYSHCPPGEGINISNEAFEEMALCFLGYKSVTVEPSFIPAFSTSSPRALSFTLLLQVHSH